MSRSADLDTQMAECKELLSEVRGAIRDLKQMKKAILDAAPEVARPMIELAVDRELSAMTRQTKEAILVAEERIMLRFERLANLLMSRHRSGRPDPGSLRIDDFITDHLDHDHGLTLSPGHPCEPGRDPVPEALRGKRR